MNSNKKEDYITMEEAMEIIKPYKFQTPEEYRDFARENPHLRLPLNPDVVYAVKEDGKI